MKRLTYSSSTKLSLIIAVMLVHAVISVAQTTAFTYQGKLADNGASANGLYDFTMTLWDAAANGTPIGSTSILLNTPVVDGVFTVTLDFGAGAFNGANRFLEISVKPSGNPLMVPTLLSPRQQVMSTPYAIKSLGSMSADSLSVACVNCITSSQIASVNGSAIVGSVNGSAINGPIPVASVPGGSSNYIQNTTTQQASANFNISGNGTAGGTLSGNAVNATIQYNLNGFRVLSNAGTNNLFAGINAGANNTSGSSNAFFGASAGGPNTTGSQNSFFGASAGHSNTTGIGNSFFGNDAGSFNTTGNLNSFFGNLAGQNNVSGQGNALFGASAGKANTTGSSNSFFGSIAGVNNTTGFDNAFFGRDAGFGNTEGNDNSFFGRSAGSSNSTGNDNSFFGRGAGGLNTTGGSNSFFGSSTGYNTTGGSNSFFGSSAGLTNTTGSNNTIVGDHANLTTNNLSNATAIGFRSAVGQSNSLVLGSINGINGATANTNVGIGTTTPNSRLDVVDTAAQIHFGDTATDDGGYLVSTLPSQAIISGGGKWNGSAWIAKSTSASLVNNRLGTILFFTNSGLTTGSTFSPTERMRITDTGDVGIGTTSPSDLLHVNGIIRVGTLGSAGSTTLCRNASNQISTCSSSLRYKTDIQPFTDGIDVVKRLHPISFTWKQSGMRDVGFGAEEVEKVEPLLTFRNAKGEIEGVKYDQITAVLVNAIKDQQTQITAQQNQIDDLKTVKAENAQLKAQLAAFAARLEQIERETNRRKYPD